MTHRKLIEQLVATLEYPHSPQSWYAKTCKEHEAITAARAYLAAPEQSELSDAKDTIELLEMRIDQLEAPEQSEPDWKKPPEYVPPLVKWAQEQTAQPAPEQLGPVAWRHAREAGGWFYGSWPADDTDEPLYTAPQPTELTDAEIEGLVVWHIYGPEGDEYFDRIEFARAVLAAQKGNQRD